MLEKKDLFPFRAVLPPGLKNTPFDLIWLNATGWSERLTGCANHGGCILGIFGIYQMIGHFKFQVKDFFEKMICRKTKLEIVSVLGVKLFSETIDS